MAPFFLSRHCLTLCSFSIQVVFDDRFKGTTKKTKHFVSVDGTNFMIYEQTPFDRRWWSHKFNGPAVRYEIAVAIYNISIVHINGPFACGANPDSGIFERKLHHILAAFERCISDKGYRAHKDKCTFIEKDGRVNGKDSSFMRKLIACITARRETVNKRFKQWGIISQCYRHNLKKHQHAFRAVAGMTQIALKTDEPLFDHDSYFAHSDYRRS
jgi:hypothetical protein